MNLNTGIDLYRKNRGWAENLGITFTSSTFTVTGANGNALSSRNAAYVGLPSGVSPGQFKSYRITASQSFVDRTGSSTINGNLFGFLTGDVQSSDVPFFLYAVCNISETSISFMICRQAGRRLSPEAADIGKVGSAIADNQWSFFALDDPTVADFAECPCLMIGSFRMQKVALNDGWGVTTLDSHDGIGQFQQNRKFFLTAGVLGAKAGSHWQNNGGTAPTMNNAESSYFMRPHGYIDYNYRATTASVNGVGAVAAHLIIPMRGDYILTTAGNPAPKHTTGRYVTTLAHFLLTTIVAQAGSFCQPTFFSNPASRILLNSDIAANSQFIAISCLYLPPTIPIA